MFYMGLAHTFVVPYYTVLSYCMIQPLQCITYLQLLISFQSKKNSTAPFVCGMLAGLFGKTFLLPFDMVKKRLQVRSCGVRIEVLNIY